MSDAASLVAQLAAAGTPPELLAAVAKELFSAESDRAAIAQRRANDRERAARSREVTPCNVIERDVTVAPALDKEIPQTPKEIKPTPYVRGTRARGKHPLPANWNPAPLKPDGQAGMIEASKPVGWIERQLSKFKDHALQNNRLCSDWDAAWRNWIKQADEIDGQQRTYGMGRHQSGSGISSTARAGLAVFGPS